MDMNMSMSGTTTLAVSTASSTSMAMATSASATMGMSMGGDSGSCKLSMLLNWNTIDACFLWSSFHIHSTFTFFLTCLGSALLVVLLEFSRRIQRGYDRYLRRKHALDRTHEVLPDGPEEKLLQKSAFAPVRRDRARAALEQFVRGVLHAFQFSISYCIMLLFMYSNGYIIISILIGAAIGFAIWTRDTLYLERNDFDQGERECC
ncbi:Copper transport protein ctr4-like protein 1 [Phlyctema vagabunda]|uniref:Copper transport protein n=1 Tax=Phlyctema vagabunda TaxID=108571 RepID=A0ABR4PE13_9HELO